jgi:hypothetical protein
MSDGFESWRAYEAEAVDRYITALRAELADLQARLRDALRLARDAEEQRAATEAAEALLGRALVTAQRVADSKIAEAQERAEAIVLEAQTHADDIVAGAHRRVREAPAPPAPPRPSDDDVYRPDSGRIVDIAARDTRRTASPEPGPTARLPQSPFVSYYTEGASALVAQVPWLDAPVPPPPSADDSFWERNHQASHRNSSFADELREDAPTTDRYAVRELRDRVRRRLLRG